ncbi:MAG: indole-3-glycerol phosphate synthase TrpC [Selenomonadaceae bacterium]|nr:indole-3-glycerol phosphate synthase TrpC [Selenomonadaceae bacterium]
MRDILKEIVTQKKDIVAEAKREHPLEKIQQSLKKGSFRMTEAFRKRSWGLIAECKLQSPAKGRLNTRDSVVDLARIYEANGAAVLSVHTDPHFLGCNEDFRKVRAAVSLPLLRKDFIIDPYQIYEARALGADAILLIVRILTGKQLASFLAIAHTLGMDALVEIHDRSDLEKAQRTEASFLGINNRNLTSFDTDIQQSLDLLPYCDPARTLISESGVRDAADARKLQMAGADGILVGESLVRADDIGAMTRSLAQP